MKKKLNLNRRPATQADVAKAQRKGNDDGVSYALAIFLTVMRDKEGYGARRLRRVWSEINALAESMARGYVTIEDLYTVLEDEAGITVR